MANGALPYMGDYLRQQRDYQLAYERAKATLETRRSDILSQYGFQQTAGGGYAVDADNQTGEYQQQRRAHYDQMQELEDMQLERGFSGGLLKQEQNQMRYAQGVEQTDFMRNILGSLGDIGRAEAETAWDYRQGRSDLLQDAINQAIENRQFTPAVLKELQGAAGSDAEADIKGTFAGGRFFETKVGLINWLRKNRPKKFGDLTNKQVIQKYKKRNPNKKLRFESYR